MSVTLVDEVNVSKLGGSLIIGHEFTVCTYDKVYDRCSVRSGGRSREA
jgi:hypothetical protein